MILFQGSGDTSTRLFRINIPCDVQFRPDVLRGGPVCTNAVQLLLRRLVRLPGLQRRRPAARISGISDLRGSSVLLGRRPAVDTVARGYCVRRRRFFGVS